MKLDELTDILTIWNEIFAYSPTTLNNFSGFMPFSIALLYHSFDATTLLLGLWDIFGKESGVFSSLPDVCDNVCDWHKPWQ